MLLRTAQLSKYYGCSRALDRLDLEVKAGEIFGLLGPNGSGKSTALRILLGFLRPTSGRAWIAGHDCWHNSVEARKQVGYLPGELRLYENMTGRQLVRFLSRLRQNPDLSAETRLAQIFDIDLSRPIAELSSGMKRKVALLQVLLPQTSLLILDEPTNTLDPTMRDQFLDQLATGRRRGQAVLFSSHVLAEVERVCDRVGILHKGRLVHVQHMEALRSVKRVWASLPVAAKVAEGRRRISASQLLSMESGRGIMSMKNEPKNLLADNVQIFDVMKPEEGVVLLPCRKHLQPNIPEPHLHCSTAVKLERK